MNKLIVKALLAMLLCACSSGYDNPEAKYFEAPSDRSALDSKILASLDVNGVSIEFERLWTTLEDNVDSAPIESFSPSIMIRQMGPIFSGPDPVSMVVVNSPYAPTTGEIYYALTGTEPPQEMIDLQVLEAHRLRRDAGFVHINPSIVVPSSIEKTWSDPPAWTSVPPAHHFEKKFTNNEAWTCHLYKNCPTTPPNPIIVYGCGNRFSAVLGTGTPGSTACPLSAGWMRVGIANLGGFGGDNPMIAQTWFGPSTAGAWSAGPAYTLNLNQYVTVDWNANSVRMAQVGQRSAAADQAFRMFTVKIIPN